METYQATISQITYHKTSSYNESGVPFLRAITTDNYNIKGEMYKPIQNQTYLFYGEWVIDPRSGQTFDFDTYEVIVENSTDGIAFYLENFIDGVGKVRARKIANHFGLECLSILRQHPSRVHEIKGMPDWMSKALADGLVFKAVIDPITYATLYDLVKGLKAFNRPIIKAIVKDFGASTIDIIKENPYILLGFRGLSWDTIDELATKRLGIDPKSLHRFKAAILEVLCREADAGHTCTEVSTVRSGVHTLCGSGPHLEAIEELRQSNQIETDIINKQQFIALCELADAERDIAWTLKALIDSHGPTRMKFDTTGLEGEQVDAVQFFETHPVAILTGPAGTGKTTSFASTIKTLHNKYRRQIVIGTPTGKAAKRVTEVTEKWIPGSGIEGSTIHRMLGIGKSDSGIGVPDSDAKQGRARRNDNFEFNEENHLDIHCGFLDELSMVGTMLFLSYIRALPPGCRFLGVGDDSQLPSIEAGAVLRDLIEGGIPTFHLTEPRRNTGRITKACHAIRNGKMPTPSPDLDLSIGENWIHIELSDMAKIAQKIVEIHTWTNRDKLKDIQVISPQNEKLPIACNFLNRILSNYFNPRPYSQTDANSNGDKRYEINDKVIRTKNGWAKILEPIDIVRERAEDSDSEVKVIHWRGESWGATNTYVVNGDVGQVIDIVSNGATIIVQLWNPDRLCMFSRGDAHLSLAYCTTIHKMQGSGAPVIIMPVHDAFYWNHRTNDGLWHREELYTGVSRAEEILFTVGKLSAIELAISRQTINRRKTRLAKFLKEALCSKYSS